MKTGYQIYFKRTDESTYHSAGLNNWFWNEKDAQKRVEELNKTWEKFGNHYIIVKLG